VSGLAGLVIYTRLALEFSIYRQDGILYQLASRQQVGTHIDSFFPAKRTERASLEHRMATRG
jgi:hypothetical protein